MNVNDNDHVSWRDQLLPMTLGILAIGFRLAPLV
jgi:hypothetical protein